MKVIQINCMSVFKCTVLVLSLLHFGYSSPVRLKREIIGDNVVSLPQQQIFNFCQESFRVGQKFTLSTIRIITAEAASFRARV